MTDERLLGKWGGATTSQGPQRGARGVELFPARLCKYTARVHLSKPTELGLPWWSRGSEFASQCKRHGFRLVRETFHLVQAS